MSMREPSRAIKLCGTEQGDVVGQTLRAGPLTAEFDKGNLRYLRYQGVEVLRALAYLVRDENWGTYTPQLEDLRIEQRSDSFKITYTGVCARADQQVAYDANIEGRSDGSIHFRATGRPLTDFVTARTGFVVLHPLKGVADHALEVEHVDGRVVKDKFPALVNPDCPFRDVRALKHEVLPGVWATCRMEGEAFEMEDHRNWTDASFKTYVRPLSKPWPYTLTKGEAFEQSVKLSFSGRPRSASGAAASNTIEVKLGPATKQKVPPLGLGMPAEEVDSTLAQIELLKPVAPKFLQCWFDPRQKHGVSLLHKYRQICDAVGATAVLEIVVQSIDDFGNELDRVAEYAEMARLKVVGVAVCPVGDLKSVLPGGKRPPAPPLEELYVAARDSFPGIKLGGGMFSFFTELNRKRPPAQLLDFVTNTTCPIVHAADDRSVMETLEALPYQIETARSFIGGTPHRVGPSSIGCRENPHGATYAPNPNNERVCLAKVEPRQRGIFSAAWTLGYIATLAQAGVSQICMAAPTGPLGLIYARGDNTQPWFDTLDGPAVYPVYHVLAGLTKGSGASILQNQNSAPEKVISFAYRATGVTRLWLANLTAQTQNVRLSGLPKLPANGRASIRKLHADNFVAVCTGRPLGPVPELKSEAVELDAYAVACIDIG